MDPAPSRLAAILTIEQLFEEAGVRTPLREGVLGALGDPTTVREVAFVSDEDWQGLASTLLFSPGTEQGVEGPSPAPVALTPVQKSRVRYLQRVARLVAGLPVERERPLPEVSAAPPPPSKRVRLSSLVDPSAEAELVNLDSSVVRTMFSSYKDKRGAFPHKDHEPTEEQLSAVAQLLGAGQAPYVDFALFGPHGKRALKKLTMVAFTYQVESGTWKRIEVPGPPDFATWWRCWLVFKTTLLLLGCVSTERPEHYGEFMRHLCETYGHEVWFIIAQADDRFRSEEMERLRRTAQISYESTSEDARATSVFQPDRPWEWAFGAALGDQGRDFWDSEVHKRALFYLTKLKTRGETLEDGTTLRLFSDKPGSRSKGSDNQAPSLVEDPPRKKKKKEKKRKPNVSKEICIKFQHGNCSEPCPHGRRHVHADQDKTGGGGGQHKGKGSGKGSKGQ